jgi:hypothetical protein
MSTATILQLTQVVGGLIGTEQLELAQPVLLSNGQPGYASIRATAAQIASLAASITPTGPVGVATAVPATGANNNYAPVTFGATTGFLELTPAGVANITGLVAGFNGQLVTITNLSSFALTLNALNAGSTAANQFRLPADMILTQNNAQSFRYSTTIGKWIPV